MTGTKTIPQSFEIAIWKWVYGELLLYAWGMIRYRLLRCEDR